MQQIRVFHYDEPAAEGYGVPYAPIDLGDPRIGGMVCRVEPGRTSRPHKHHEQEAFLILSGNGTIYGGGVSAQLSKGQCALIPAFMDHRIENGGQDTLEFLSVYWIGGAPEDSPQQKPSLTGRTLIISTPPTPNGDLHLGHLSGPYLAADILRRASAAKGNMVTHLSGRDDHQTYVTTKSLRTGWSAAETAKEYAGQILETLRTCDIPLDYFTEPNSDGEYARFVSEVFSRLIDRGYIIPKTTDALFDSVTGEYLHEAHVRGKCPHCGSDSDGNACEECGRPNDCIDLADPISKATGTAPESRPCTRLYFRFGAFAKSLKNYVDSTPMSAHALVMSKSMLEQGLPDICVSHPSRWGIPVPAERFKDQVIYVWFEMAAGYLYAAASVGGQTAPALEKGLPFFGQSGDRVVHCYGFDNTYYHTLLFPAVYEALDLDLVPPQYHVVNELLDLRGHKFSTSRLHLIWGRELLARVPADYLRWHLCEIRPEGLRGDFTMERFKDSCNQLFAVDLRALVSMFGELLQSHCAGHIPAPGAWTDEHRRFYETILDIHRHCWRAYEPETFSPRSVTWALRSLVSEATRFLAAQRVFVVSGKSPEHSRSVIALLALALRIFGQCACPITPRLGSLLLMTIGLGEKGASATSSDFVPSGRAFMDRLSPALVSVEDDLTDLEKLNG